MLILYETLYVRILMCIIPTLYMPAIRICVPQLAIVVYCMVPSYLKGGEVKWANPHNTI